MSNRRLSKADQQALEDLRVEIGHWQQQGIHSLSKLNDLVELMLCEGRSMSDVAGGAGNIRYNQLMQAVLDLGNGRAAKRHQSRPPKLVQTVASKTNGRIKIIKLTRKGTRLRQRLLNYVRG